MSTNESLKPKRKKEYGIISPVIMKIFRLLQYLPFQVFYGNKTDHYYSYLHGKTKQEQELIVRKRALKMDIIILSYLIFEIILPVVYENFYHQNWLKYFIIVVLVFRLIDIIQVNVNMILFDTVRTRGSMRITKYTRAIILILWNYFEIILIFGFLYLAHHELLDGYAKWTDSYYFSTITQLTIGYGDLSPTEGIRFVSAFQGLVGTLFLALIISKIISLAPELKEIDKEE